MAQEAFTEIELVRETEAPLFVINLCASTTPVALAHPDNPELKRFTFFVTRRREEGRERFRLHMGYFNKLDEAEKLLNIVRDVYPAAWAGPAPSARTPAPRPAVATPQLADATSVRAIVTAPVPGVAKVAPVGPTLRAPAPVRVPVVVPAPVIAAKTTRTFDSMSNVREVLAELGDDVKPAVAIAARIEAALSKPPPIAQPSIIPELTLEATGRHVTPNFTAAAAPIVAKQSLSDSQVLRVLEERRDPPVIAPPVPSEVNAATSIRMLTPEDTQTLRDIKLDVQANAQVSFAVQLQWSVIPIDMTALPQLAIFDAYTLYTVEGNRQGRRWYGLRLGFFTDAMSAKQVACYVRSDFTSVAVVPVTAKERDRANGTGEPSSRTALDIGATGSFVAPARALAAASAVPQAPKPVVAAKPESKKEISDIPGFKLLDNDQPTPLDAADAKVKKSVGKRPAVRGRAARGQITGAPHTLEQTLEVLGASTLSIEKSSTIINDSGVRHLDMSIVKKKSSRFSRLLDRLAEKM
ncbi:MAG: hypothetical protein ABIT36_02350 [Steroidobacteraceae bacterium]